MNAAVRDLIEDEVLKYWVNVDGRLRHTFETFPAALAVGAQYIYDDKAIDKVEIWEVVPTGKYKVVSVINPHNHIEVI